MDNTSAMSSFVKGTSKSPELEHTVNLFWMLAWHLRIQVWFEWVDRGSKWSDGVSREFDLDDFAGRHGFELVEMRQPSDEWSSSWRELWSFAARASA